MKIKKNGFSLTELMVVVAIISILAAIMAVSAHQAIEKAKIARILSVCDNLRKTCLRHFEDTGMYALERNINDAAAPANHQLSMDQTAIYATWNGPYINAPLGYSDSPYRASIDVANNLSSWGAYATGFDMDRDGAADTMGPGNFLFIACVPDDTASKIDNRIDGPGGAAAWNSCGAVEWISGSGNMRIYLCGGN